MLTSVRGYFDGSHIIMDEKVELIHGQRVIITILDQITPPKKNSVDLSRYQGRGAKMFHTDAQDYVKGLRSDDRL